MESQLTWQQKEWLKCARDFEYFAATYVEILNVGAGGLVPFNLYGFQKRVLKDFETHKFNIVRKFRQGGLTTMAVIWGLWLCMFRKNQQILLMSIGDREALQAGRTAQMVLDRLETEHSWLFPVMIEDSGHTKSFAVTQSKIEFRTPKAARGQALTYVIIDEAAFIPKMEEAWAAMYPTVNTGGNVIVISTVNGMGNWYEEMYTDAAAGRNEFHVIDLNWKEHPDYNNPEWERRTRANLSAKKWAQEIEGSFLSSGDTYISSDILSELDQRARNVDYVKKLFAEWDSDKRLFDLHVKSDDPDIHEWNKVALWIYKEPEDGQDYVIGVDVAEGVGDDGDNSAFEVIDSTTLEQVAEFSSNTVPPHVFSMILARIGIYYHTALVAVENAGPGIAIIDKLENNLYYENIYYQRVKTQEKAGVTMNRTTRPIILESMQNYIQNRLVKVNSMRFVRELKYFIFEPSRKRAEAQRGKHDDTVMAMAIALYVRDRSMRDVPFGYDMPVTLADSHLSELYEKIRAEIENAAPEDLLIKSDEDRETWEMDDILTGVKLPFVRRDDAILREFGW